MKIFFACHRYPYPPNRGGKIRPFNMIRHLSEKHEVTVATVAHSQEEVEAGADLRKHCARVLYDVIPSPVRWAQAASVLPTRLPSSVQYFRSGKLLSDVVEISRREKFDAVVVHCAFAAQYARQVDAPLRMMDFGDLDSGKWLDYAHERRFPMSAAYWFEAKKLRRYELELARKFTVCTFTAPGELDEFRAMAPGVRSDLIPNGVDATFFRLRTPRAERPPVIAFLGRMDYFPNVKGAIWFANEVFPLIQKRRSDAVFRIIGSNPIGSITALTSNPGVKVTGSVPDVREFLDDVAVSVVPLTLARGTQNKMLECMAMGVPVVATPQAAKGVHAKVDRDYLVASSAEEWTAAVIRVIESAQLEEQLAASGRAQVESAHNWVASMAKLDALLFGAAVGEPIAGRAR
jgi:sugar transferase (PEP-CTERM/EpsH1 system associated)